MSEEIAATDHLLAELARLRSRLDHYRAEYAQLERAMHAERAARRNAEADLSWWHATVANFFTSATTEDRALLRETLAEALPYPHAGTMFLAELSAAWAAVAAMRLIDKHRVGAYETAAGWVEPCDDCGEMREIAKQALQAYDEATKARGSPSP